MTLARSCFSPARVILVVLAATVAGAQMPTPTPAGADGTPGIQRPTVRGDLNCDGRVDLADADAFVLALGDPEAWQSTYRGCNILNGDLNGDGKVDFDDIGELSARLAGKDAGSAGGATDLRGISPKSGADAPADEGAADGSAGRAGGRDRTLLLFWSTTGISNWNYEYSTALMDFLPYFEPYTPVSQLPAGTYDLFLWGAFYSGCFPDDKIYGLQLELTGSASIDENVAYRHKRTSAPAYTRWNGTSGIPLHHGIMAAVTTDGITAALNPNGDLYNELDHAFLIGAARVTLQPGSSLEADVDWAGAGIAMRDGNGVTVPDPMVLPATITAAAACCFENGECLELIPWDCAEWGGSWQGGPCEDSPCWGSCCYGDGGCEQLSIEDCRIEGGLDWQWTLFQSCTPNPCIQPAPGDYLLGRRGGMGFSGESVNTATGNFFHQQTDLSIAARGPALQFTRYYNSLDPTYGPLGPGWGHSYFIVLEDDLRDTLVSVRWADGQRTYWKTAAGDTYEPAQENYHDELVHHVDGSWTVTKTSRDTYTFDAQGRLIALADRNGNTTTLAYTNPTFEDSVTEITDPVGRTLALSYNDDGLLATLTDFATTPRTVQFSYDADGYLVEVVDVLDHTIAYDYYSTGGFTVKPLETITDQRHVVIVNNAEYDEDRRVTRQLDGNENETLFDYPRDPNDPNSPPDPNHPDDATIVSRTVTIDGEQQTLRTIHHFEPLYKQLVKVVNPFNDEVPFGDEVLYGYDDHLQRNSITDRNSNVTTFEYDGLGNVIRASEADDPNDPHDGGDTLVEFNDPNCPYSPTRKTNLLGYVTQWTYDERCNVLSERRYIDLAKTQYVEKTWTYNEFGQPLTETDERGNVHESVYDADGLLTEARQWDNTNPNSPALMSRTWYGYDELWRRVWVTDGRGSAPEDPNHTTSTTYDLADRVTQTAGPLLGSPPHNIIRTAEYDVVGNKTRETDGKGYLRRYGYDFNNNLVGAFDPNDGHTGYQYDELNRKIREIDANGHSTTFKYDDANRLVEKKVGDLLTWTYTYDAHGNMLTETDPSSVTLMYGYDARNRRVLTRNELTCAQRTVYDELGQTIASIDGNGYETQFNYDGLGRLACVVDAEGGWTEYMYDQAGNLLQIEDARDAVVSIREYDALNRLTRAEDGNGNFFQYGYDAVGNQIWVLDANCQQTDLTYDAESRLIDIAYPDASWVTHEYDDNGNRTALHEPLGSSTFTYDNRNRLASSTDRFGKQVQYGYDPVGNRTSLTYPGAEIVTYTFDAANRLTAIADWADPPRTTGYDYDGVRLTSVAYPNGLTETRAYDNAARLTQLQTADPNATVLLRYAWPARDCAGNPTEQSETGTLPATLEQLVTEYDYDTDNRLVESSQGTYQYDANGNLVSRTVNGVATTFAYDVEDRLVAQTRDPNGPTPSTVQHVYDGQSYRIARIDNGAETRYVLDRGRSMSHVLCETDASGNITAYYIHGPQIVARIAVNGRAELPQYYHTSDIGNVAALSDPNGVLTDRYAYEPFGLPKGQAGATEQPFTYVGGLGVMAEADGLYFMRARFYDPDTGRFLGKDPVEGALTDPLSLHKYAYGLNTPIVMTDPTGEFVFIPILLAALAMAFIDYDIYVVGECILSNQKFDPAVGAGRFVGTFTSSLVTGGLSKLSLIRNVSRILSKSKYLSQVPRVANLLGSMASVYIPAAIGGGSGGFARYATEHIPKGDFNVGSFLASGAQGAGKSMLWKTAIPDPGPEHILDPMAKFVRLPTQRSVEFMISIAGRSAQVERGPDNESPTAE